MRSTRTLSAYPQKNVTSRRSSASVLPTTPPNYGWSRLCWPTPAQRWRRGHPLTVPPDLVDSEATRPGRPQKGRGGGLARRRLRWIEALLLTSTVRLPWYRSDLQSNSDGTGSVTVIGRFTVETFAVEPNTTAAPVVHPGQDAASNPFARCTPSTSGSGSTIPPTPSRPAARARSRRSTASTTPECRT